MLDPFLNTAGLLEGLDIMCRGMEDTKLISYLAINSTAGNKLGLKELSHEYCGNYAVDVKDTTKVSAEDLLRYNLIDCLATQFVYEKNYPIMVADAQETIYRELFLPSVKVIIQMQNTGMPMSPSKIADAKAQLEKQQSECLNIIENSQIVLDLNKLLQVRAMDAANAKLKVKVKPLSDFEDVRFNPNSGLQLQILLYESMELPVLDCTDTKQPATGADTIEKCINHTGNPEYKELLSALIGHGKVSKILSTFIPAFEAGIVKSDGMQYIHGSFNLGGTVSGRLSSNSPNLTNIPSGSDYGKLVKSCFDAPPGWLFVGADFSSLEDYISALTTKDPNKMRVYLDHYDGHCLRAKFYFSDKCPDIVDTLESINSMKKLYPKLRQDSKPITFMLTYGGTYHGLMNNLGWPKEEAQAIEANYHELYKVSDQFIQKRLQQAAIDGYVTVAFGLRVRTPLLKQVIFGGSKMPFEAAAEGRTAGNAMGQSYCQLNNRAANAFMAKVWESKYRLDIKPVAQVHDANYLLIRDDVEVVEWVNRELILAMQWQELEEIKHDLVKLGGALDIHYKGWHQPITLPNNATQDQIREIAKKGQYDYDNH